MVRGMRTFDSQTASKPVIDLIVRIEDMIVAREEAAQVQEQVARAAARLQAKGEVSHRWLADVTQLTASQARTLISQGQRAILRDQAK